MEGRYWLRLEWRALARALRESGEQRNLAVRDALAFRQARRTLYPASVEDERGQEIGEGLAAYTGTVLAGDSAADAAASVSTSRSIALAIAVLIASDGRSRRVSAPVRRDDGTFAGDGWTFKAAAGWVVREGSRRGDDEVVRQQQ
jgi:hypothetical protein